MPCKQGQDRVNSRKYLVGNNRWLVTPFSLADTKIPSQRQQRRDFGFLFEQLAA